MKLSVEVDAQEFEKDLEAAFRRIAREVRIPGFRPGRAPRRILEARLGADVGRQEALREALPAYYTRAVNESAIDVIAPPELDITAGQEEGPVSFDAVVEVRPKVAVPGYGNLRVTVPSPAVTEDEVDAQVEQLRSQFGELQPVGRSARDGDHLSIDIAGSVDGEPADGLTADDFLYEVGSGAVVAELDQQLRGAKVGDILVFDAEHPDPEEEAAIRFRVLVKDVKEKVLPQLDDEWANEASEFDTLEELRADFRQRMATMKRGQVRYALRDGVVAALVELVEEEAPQPLVAEEVQRRVRELAQNLAARDITIEQYLEVTGRTVEQLLAELETPAASAVKADLALRAVIEAEQTDVSDEEVDAHIERFAEAAGQKPAAMRRSLERSDGVEAVRSDLRKQKALEWLVERAEVVDDDGRPVERGELEAPDAGEPDDGEDPEPTTESDDANPIGEEQVT